MNDTQKKTTEPTWSGLDPGGCDLSVPVWPTDITARRYLIWWTVNYQAEQTALPVGCPSYIREQLRDRRGRNGRGRLWVAPEIPLENMDRPDAAPRGMGGIVIYPHHLSIVRELPGVVTDLNGESL